MIATPKPGCVLGSAELLKPVKFTAERFGGAKFTVNVTFVLAPVLSVTVTVIGTGPPAEGVPEIQPVAGSMLKPAGSVALNVKGGVPPVTATH